MRSIFHIYPEISWPSTFKIESRIWITIMEAFLFHYPFPPLTPLLRCVCKRDREKDRQTHRHTEHICTFKCGSHRSAYIFLEPLWPLLFMNLSFETLNQGPPHWFSYIGCPLCFRDYRPLLPSWTSHVGAGHQNSGPYLWTATTLLTRRSGPLPLPLTQAFWPPLPWSHHSV